MLRYIEKPHLPQGRVRHIILGEKYRNLLENALFDNNLCPIWLKNNDFVDKRLSGHCDLMAAHLGNNVLAVSEFLQNSEFINNNELQEIKLITVPEPQHKQYPYDAGLNFCIIGDKLIYNPKTAEKSVISKLGYKRLECRQGYTKCSICVADENAIITSDSKIAQIAELNGIDSLLVDESITALDGFEHGFIGGASFKINRNKIAFTGVIKDKTERHRIESFLSKYDTEAVYLTEYELFDIGSAIPLTEEIF